MNEIQINNSYDFMTDGKFYVDKNNSSRIYLLGSDDPIIFASISTHIKTIIICMDYISGREDIMSVVKIFFNRENVVNEVLLNSICPEKLHNINHIIQFIATSKVSIIKIKILKSDYNKSEIKSFIESIKTATNIKTLKICAPFDLIKNTSKNIANCKNIQYLNFKIVDCCINNKEYIFQKFTQLMNFIADSNLKYFKIYNFVLLPGTLENNMISILHSIFDKNYSLTQIDIGLFFSGGFRPTFLNFYDITTRNREINNILRNK